MTAQFPAHCEALNPMNDDRLYAIFHERLTEKMNELQDIKFQLAESIDNRGYKDLEPVYRQVEIAYTSLLLAIRAIPK